MDPIRSVNIGLAPPQPAKKLHGLMGIWQSIVHNHANIHAGLLHCALSCTVYCNRFCLFVVLCVCIFICLLVCYHDNSKLHASIFTKLDL